MVAQAARRRIARLVVLVAVAATYFTLSGRWPRDNVVHVVLGVAAPGVTQMRLRYAPAAKNAPIDEDWTREATFSFPDGSAPRVVTHEPRLADGDYVVEIEILKASHAIVNVRRPRVPLAGGTTSIDVSEAAATADAPPAVTR
jgi:hypothetical protein